MPPNHIAVLGGGITGLSSAFHLSRRFPQTRISLFERSQRCGGWVKSKRVDVEDAHGNKANICLEAGPRTLRPNTWSVQELVSLLDLKDSLIYVPKGSDAARNRFLHIPGTTGLTALPPSIPKLLFSPLGWIIWAAIRGLYKEGKENMRRDIKGDPDFKEGAVLKVADESFDALLTRTFGEELATILGSSLIHGIYAADSRTLSAKAAFPIMLNPVTKEIGTIAGVLYQLLERRQNIHKVVAGYTIDKDVLSMLEGASVFSFKHGMETITTALEEYLQEQSNVTLRKETSITALEPPKEEQAAKVTLEDGEAIEASHVVSSIPLPELHEILPSQHTLPHLTANPSSSVTVINLVFPPSPKPLHPSGFGYLIPRPASGYSAQHPGLLGVIFDSCSLSAQDRGAAGFTKLTMMLGGPYPITPTHTELPVVLSHLQDNLNADLPEPVYVEKHENVNCIPTPTVGHVERMDELRKSLRDGPWGGRLEVVGAGVTGVSIGDCVEAGRNAGKDW